HRGRDPHRHPPVNRPEGQIAVRAVEVAQGRRLHDDVRGDRGDPAHPGPRVRHSQPLVYELTICTTPVPSMTSPASQASTFRAARNARARSASCGPTIANIPTPMLNVLSISPWSTRPLVRTSSKI